MRIWAFPSFYPYDFPGYKWAGSFAHRQYLGLVANGADIKVIQPVYWNPPFPFSELHPQWSMYRNLNYPEKRVLDGIEIYHPRISNIKPNRLEKRSYHQRYVDAITGFFRKNGIALNRDRDIFFSQWLLESAMVQDAAHELGVKSAILGIGDDIVNWPRDTRKTFETFAGLWKLADRRLVCADYLGRDADSILGEHLDYEVIKWGVDYDYFRPAVVDEKQKLRQKLGLPADKIVVLSVGSPIMRKGWLDLLDGLTTISGAKDSCVIAAVYGGGKEIDIKDECAKRGLSDLLIDQGEVAPEQIAEWYRAADIFCLPSHWEGLANANIEAMASGLPVLTTDVCGHPELVTSGVNGILIPPKRPDILGAELGKLITDVDLRTRLGATARAFIVDTWGDYKFNSAKLYNVLKETLEA